MSSGRIVWAAAVAVAIVTRTAGLGRWPGLNGDEAWYGVNVEEWLAGGAPFLSTGVGNPLNPIHSGLLLLVSSIFEPSVALLRIPGVILGVAAVLLAYPLLRKPIGERAALIATVLLAVSPTAIVYSRLGWDPSGTPFITLLALAAALHDRAVLAMGVMALAYLVHPTNIFALPVVAAAWIPHGMAHYRRAASSTRRRVMQGAISAAILAVPFGAWALIKIANNPATPLPSFSMALERIISPQLWFEHFLGALELLSGITSVAYVAAAVPLPVVIGSAAIVGVVVLGSHLYAFRCWRAQRHSTWLLAGVAASFAGFHVVAIPAAFQPGFERYALFLLIPMVIVASIAIAAAAEQRPAAGMVLAGTVTATMIAVITLGYFRPLVSFGGGSELTYRTGAVEPKLAAFRFIDQDSHDAESVTIVAEDWWLYWSLRYFAGAHTRFFVEPGPNAAIPGGTHPPSAASRPAPASGRKYIVRFGDAQAPPEYSQAQFTAADPIGRPIVEVFLLSGQHRP